MKRKKIFRFKVNVNVNVNVNVVILLFVITLFSFPLQANETNKEIDYTTIEERVMQLMKDGDIPGLSLALIKGERPVYLKGFGYADLETKQPVTPGTLFQLASTSKAFTALAALHMEKEGLINLDDPVSKYLEGFYVTYEGNRYPITLRQLLHHTSGIPVKTISNIPESSDKDALQQTVRAIEGIELSHMPGEQYEYATINYDVIGAVIENVSGLTFEEYMEKNILKPLGLNHTVIGVGRLKEKDLKSMSTGYKIGFFKPRKYDAPIYRGNNPAGYIISNGIDLARWLKLQMGMEQTDLAPLIQKTHEPDRSVLPNHGDFSAYAMGWEAYVSNIGIIDHGGLNPNFTAYLAMVPREKTAVAVLSNSNSNYTEIIGINALNMLRGRGPVEPKAKSNALDKGASVITVILGIAILCIIAFLVLIFVELFRGKRKLDGFTFKKAVKLFLVLLVFVPFLLGVYFIPGAVMEVSWETAIVWSPISFHVAILMILSLLGLIYIGFFLSILFPHKNEYIKSAPLLLILSLGSGGANAAIIFLVTNALFNTRGLFYQLYYYGVAFLLYIVGRKVLQTKLIKLSMQIIFDLRLKLVEKICYTSYQKFEKMESGRVLATLGDDTGQIGNSANVLIQIITGSITSLGAFIYLATIAFWATVVTLSVVITIASLYYYVSRKTVVYFEEGRSTQNTYMQLINGLIDGFKELSLQFNKRLEYKKDIEANCHEFQYKISLAFIKFVNAFLVGESLLLVVLGIVGFGIPRFFPDISTFTLMGFVMVLLYLIGPVTIILNSIPAIQRIKVSWNRVKQFMEDVPQNIDLNDVKQLNSNNKVVKSFEARGLEFEYEAKKDEDTFKVGPIDLDAHQGEIIFIIGGNGSGKTTLGKLLTGLYIPDKGTIKLDNKAVNNYQLGEYFSAVFSDYHLFEKLYNVELTGREDEVYHYIKLLRLEEKVVLENNAFSTIDLSGGQRKRLALLQCYLENNPIYLFDEVAADQDPEFRKFFYRNLLPKMKEEGKIVIAITHDDHYFDAADKIIKMDMGKIDFLEKADVYKVTR
jgi:cyclic peptide transporter